MRMGRLCRVRRQDLRRQRSGPHHQQGAARLRTKRIQEAGLGNQDRNHACGIIATSATAMTGSRSIEMIEAVGEQFWPKYFSQLRDRLLPGGLAGITGHHHSGQPVPGLSPRSRFHPALCLHGRRNALAADADNRSASASSFPSSASAFSVKKLCQDACDLSKQLPRGLAEPDAHQASMSHFRRLWEYYLAYGQARFTCREISTSFRWCVRKSG